MIPYEVESTPFDPDSPDSPDSPNLDGFYAFFGFKCHFCVNFHSECAVFE